MYRTAGKNIARGFTLAALAALLIVLQAGSARAQWATNGANINTTNTGNVGVGTSTPDTPLGDTGQGKTVNVQSDSGYSMLRLTRGAAGSGEMGRVTFGSPAFTSTEKRTAVILSRSETAATADPSGALLFFTTTAGTMTEKMRINSAGSIGIGTGTPGTFLGGISGSGRMLHLVNTTDHAHLMLSSNGAGKFSTINMEVGDATATRRVFQTRYDGANNAVRYFFFNEASGAVTQDNVLTLKNTGHIGIGTSTPDSALGDTGQGKTVTVQSDSGYSMLRLTRGTAGSGEMGRVTFGSPAFTSAEKRTAVIQSRSETTSTADPSGNLIFYIANAGLMAEKMRITSAGNVGIGTNAPSTALHVVGDVTVTGNISAKYQDLAEWVPSTEKLAAGTVVILDPERSNHVLASTASYDTAVAGVISAQPGIALGEAGEGKALVATTGRVKVKVDATRAPVKIGDLLVTSDVAGVAMKSEPVTLGGRRMHAPGTIIGKALEPLAGGTGEILVLLSLQ